MADRQHQIYVALLDAGEDRWRRVDAVRLSDDTFRITSPAEPAQERWEYGPGQVVRCRTMTLPTGERVLVATQRVGGPATEGPNVRE